MRCGPAAKLVTPAELRCATAVSEGLRQKEVGPILGRSEKTVKAHLYNLQKKLGVHNSSQMTRRLIELGYLKVNVQPLSEDRISELLRMSVEAAFAVLARELSGEGVQ